MFTHPAFKSHTFNTSDLVSIVYQTNFHKLPETPVIVFNYGLVCSHEHWRHQIEFLHELGFSILLHDYRGHYGSGGKDHIEKITFERIRTDIAELLSSLQIKHCLMLGHSLGVNISLDYALHHPDQVKGLVLICGTVVDPTDVMFDSSINLLTFPYLKKINSHFPQTTEKIWKQICKNNLVKKIIHQQGFNKASTPTSFIDIYTEKMCELGPEIFLRMMEEMKNQNLLPKLFMINTPTLIFAGEKDSVIPIKWQELTHSQLPNSTFHIVAEGSHVPQIDFPQLINERIKEFLVSLSS